MALAAQKPTNRAVVFVVVVFISLLQHPPHTPVLKGLTSLCGSRSLSCTDLINNFYQPLAQEISRGWAGAGGGCGGVRGEDREGGGALAGRGGVG